jgi:TonB family protein
MEWKKHNGRLGGRQLWWGWLSLALALVFASSMASPVRVSAQDSTTETVRRLKSKVLPEYPKVASQLKLQGKVRIEITISADGHVTNTKVLGGHPVLANSAVAAVKQWLFEPGAKDTTEVVEVTFAGREQ